MSAIVVKDSQSGSHPLCTANTSFVYHACDSSCTRQHWLGIPLCRRYCLLIMEYLVFSPLPSALPTSRRAAALTSNANLSHDSKSSRRPPPRSPLVRPNAGMTAMNAFLDMVESLAVSSPDPVASFGSDFVQGAPYGEWEELLEDEFCQDARCRLAFASKRNGVQTFGRS